MDEKAKQLSRELQDALDAIESSASGYQLELSLDVADLVLRGLADRKMTQKDLSIASGVPEARITGYVHGNHNPTLLTVARLLHALGIKPRIMPEAPTETSEDIGRISTFEETDGNTGGKVVFEETGSDEEVLFQIKATGSKASSVLTTP